VFCRDYELELWNLLEESSSLVGDSRTGTAFQTMVRDVFEIIRSTARWRYSGDTEDRAYFEYRLQHGLSPSFEALRCFVRARRFCNGPEKKLEQYQRSLLHDPCLGAALRNIAFLHKEQKKYNLALRYYREAVAVLIDRATLSEAYSEMGLCYANAGRLESALECWHKASHWDPSNTDVYANLAIAYEEKGSLEDAIRYFIEAQRLDPEYYWACRGLGRIYCNQGQWREAIEQLHKQVRIAPKDAWGHYALGSCYAREGKLEEAREYLRRALELDPDGDAGRKAFQGLMQIDA
jgi:tetratricopeptide (TPR) repeat protein